MVMGSKYMDQCVENVDAVVGKEKWEKKTSWIQIGMLGGYYKVWKKVWRGNKLEHDGNVEKRVSTEAELSLLASDWWSQ